MSLKNWSKQHTFGLIIGLITIFISSLIVAIILGYNMNMNVEKSLFYLFNVNYFTAKAVSFACISNLIWFHFASLKKENWGLGMGIILATFIGFLTFAYFRFIA